MALEDRTLSQAPLAIYWRKRRAAYHAKPADSPKLKQETRRCLSCEKDFSSSWNGNRMCSRCLATQDSWS
tara:strand:- start:231 stop:440 length:210 start_codon:yes stop_codon:yes gene_type:complete